VVKRRTRKASTHAPHWWLHLVWAFDARLDKGAKQYGDESFARPLQEIEREILEELVDTVGWLFVAWCRVQSIASPAARARKRFLAAVCTRLLIGAWVKREDKPAAEIERLAAVAACQWEQMRSSLEHLGSRVFALEAEACAAKHQNTTRTGDAYIGRRGGLSE
jgi:hypothetical protein